MVVHLKGVHCYVRNTNRLRIVCSAKPNRWDNIPYRLLCFWEPAMNIFIEQPECTQCGAYQAVDAGFYVEYQADPWPIISTPSDSFWMVPGSVNLGSH